MAQYTSAGLGNGGANYSDADAALKKKIAQNTLNLKSDPNYNQSEVSRTLQVIQNRQGQGLDTSAQQKYLTSNLGYNAAGSTPTATNPTTSPTNANSNMSQYTELMNQMKDIANRQSTPFSYEANSDPAYQAALKRAQANIDTGNSATQAEMNRRGILNSTITSDRMGEIASQEMGNVETSVLPQLMQQAYQRYMDEESKKQQQFSNLGSMASMFQNEDQRGIDNNFAESDRTGNYLPPEAKSIVSNILQLKQQAEAKGISAADRAQLSAKADGFRAQLAAMNIDPSAYASSVSANNIVYNPGIRTLAGQQLDMQKQDQKFNQGQQQWQNNFQNEQFAYQKARDSITDQQWKAKFDEDVRQNGLSYGMQMLQENNQQAYREAQIGLSQDDSARQWAQLDYSMSNPSSQKSGGLTANQVLDNIKNMYTEPVYQADKLGNQTKVGTQITKDASKRGDMFLNVVDAGLSDTETNQVLATLGFTKEEISKYKGQYSGK